MCYVLILKKGCLMIFLAISLLLDESNDIYIIRLLGVSVIYFTHASNKAKFTY